MSFDVFLLIMAGIVLIVILLNEASQEPVDHNPLGHFSPREQEFVDIVNEALDRGVKLTYAQIGERMGLSPARISQWGPGGRYTKLRQAIYTARGIR